MDHLVVLFLIFLKEALCCFPQWLYHFAFPPTVYKGSKISTSSPTVPCPSYMWFFKLFSTLGATPIFSPQTFFFIQLENSSSAAYNHVVLIDTQTLPRGRVLFAHFKHLLLFLWPTGQKHNRNAIQILGSLMLFSKDLFSIRICDLDTASKHTECKM